MEVVLSTQAEIHFVVSLAWDGFVQHMLRYFLCPRCNDIGLGDIIYDAFFSSHAWEGFGQHILRYILCPRCHAKGIVTQVEMLVYCSLAEEGLANSGEAVFCVLTWMVWVGLTQVHIYFVSSLGLEVFGQHMLRCILCLRWLGRV